MSADQPTESERPPVHLAKMLADHFNEGITQLFAPENADVSDANRVIAVECALGALIVQVVGVAGRMHHPDDEGEAVAGVLESIIQFAQVQGQVAGVTIPRVIVVRR